MNLLKISVVFFLIVTAPLAQASDTFFCSLTVKMGNKIEVEIKNRAVTVRAGELQNAFGESATEIKRQIVLPVDFLVELDPADETQLNIGMYFFNRMEKTGRKLVASASGSNDGRVRILTTHWQSYRDFDFSCAPTAF